MNASTWCLCILDEHTHIILKKSTLIQTSRSVPGSGLLPSATRLRFHTAATLFKNISFLNNG